MREWLQRHGGYWTFGLFLLALLGAMGGMGVWGLSAQDARQNARVESVFAQVGKVSAVAESGIRRVEEKVGSEVKRLDNRVDNVLELIRQIDARFDRVDERLDRVDERLDRVDERLSRVDERFDRMDAKLDRMNAKLDRLITGLAAPAAK